MKHLVLTRRHKIVKSALEDGRKVKVEDVDQTVLNDFLNHKIAVKQGNFLVLASAAVAA